jgi:Mn2+/Fe2+ NRAMP family transporter
MAIATQSLNAIVLPLVFFFLIKLTNSKKIMGIHANSLFQKYFSSIFTGIIMIALFVAVLELIFHW